MTLVGIVAEYNPFHNGHAYQIKCIRERIPDAAIVICMSGSFTQRGEVALLDKWTRAKMAIQGGADLVLELPFIFACRSAQDFASGAIRLLNAFQIEVIAFGAESDELSCLQRIARETNAPHFQELLHGYIQNGCSYAVAFEKTCHVQDLNVSDDMLKKPNNILALEYLRAILQLGENTKLQPLLIQRRGCGYHDTALAPLASSSAIRKAITSHTIDWEKISMSLSSENFLLLKMFPKEEIAHTGRLFRPFLLRLYTSRRFSSYYGYQEGIENRFYRIAKSVESREEFLQKVSTKRYSKSRISRLMTYALLEIRQGFIQQADTIGPQYIRPLAMNQKGAEILRKYKKQEKLPILTKLSQYCSSPRTEMAENTAPMIGQRVLSYDILATHIRSLATDRMNLPDDYTHSPTILL